MSKSCCATEATISEDTFFQKMVLYRPLIMITGISIAAATALSVTGHIHFMNSLMGLFLCFLSALKLFNLKGFAIGFAQYDLLAANWKPYATLYPFIELGLGLSYLANLSPTSTNMIMVIVMLIGTLGVLKTIRSKQSVQCACVGTGFNLPVGYVTLAENLIMGLMAAINLFA